VEIFLFFQAQSKTPIIENENDVEEISAARLSQQCK
jgi:hypothetical protein